MTSVMPEEPQRNPALAAEGKFIELCGFDISASRLEGLTEGTTN
jgi:hypothetical protein